MSWRAAAAVLAAAATGCGAGGGGGEQGGTGAAVARAILASFEAAETVRAPWRCALGPAAPAAPAIAATAPAGWTRDGERLTATRARGRLTLAAVAQARGAAVDVRAGLRAAHVDVVVALGGMGGDAAASKAALGALVDPAWLVVALPGDLEAWPAHAAAIADLAAAGAAIVDGATVRLIDNGAAVIATVPGERWAARLADDGAGCVHDPADVGRTLAALATAAGDRPRVLALAPAPQGGASDVAAGGLHAGDPQLGAALDGAGLDLVVHGPLGPVPALAAGSARRGAAARLAAGALDPLARRTSDGRAAPGGAVVAVIDGRGVSWRFVPAP